MPGAKTAETRRWPGSARRSRPGAPWGTGAGRPGRSSSSAPTSTGAKNASRPSPPTSARSSSGDGSTIPAARPRRYLAAVGFLVGLYRRHPKELLKALAVFPKTVSYAAEVRRAGGVVQVRGPGDGLQSLGRVDMRDDDR